MSGKTVIKYLNTPQMRRYTTLWNVCAQKSQWPRAECSELPCHARFSLSKQLLKCIYALMLASFCSLMKIYLQQPHRKTHRTTDCTHTHQPWRKTKRLCTQLTFSQWWHQTANYRRLTLHQSDTCRSQNQG